MSEANVDSKLLSICKAFTLEKRFKNNYEIISHIGTGGFAKVIKAKHLLDDMEYAIKKIKIDTENKSASEIVNELEQILLEIRCFSKIQHKHIVKYNHSWIEVNLHKEDNSKFKKFSKEKKENYINFFESGKKHPKSRIKNSENKKRKNSYQLSEVESSGISACEFTDESYECGISWEGTEEVSNNFDSNITPKNKSYEEEEENNIYLNDNSSNDLKEVSKLKHVVNIENEVYEFNSDFSDIELQNIREINTNMSIKKKNLLEKNNETSEKIQRDFDKSVSDVNEITEDFYDGFKKKFKKQSNKTDIQKILAKKLEEVKIPINNEEYSISRIKNFTIYIQMELCKHTLEDFLIEKRISNKISNSFKNKMEFLENEKSKQKETLEKLEIFLEITKAINYLHEKENIIHRDIKPKNILFSIDGGIKVGDFGLATYFYNKKYSEQENLNIRKFSLESKTTNFTKRSSFPLCSSNPELDLNEKFNTKNYTYFHTKNIGTLLYASPEQLSENFYDYKSDIYSLGLVLFELMNPFNTQMEKNLKLQDIKKGIVPQDFLLKEPHLSKLILRMCDQDPKNRPNTKEIIEVSLEEISRKYFSILESIISVDDYDFSNSREIIVKRNNSLNQNTIKYLSISGSFNDSNFKLNEDNLFNNELRKAKSSENDIGKLNFSQHFEDFYITFNNERRNLNLQCLDSIKKIDNINNKFNISQQAIKKELNFINSVKFKNEKLRFTNLENSHNYNYYKTEEKEPNNSVLFGNCFLVEKDFTLKENPEKLNFKEFHISKKTRNFIKISGNSLSIYEIDKLNKAYKNLDLNECYIQINEEFGENLTQISLEIPFVNFVHLFFEKSQDNDIIITKMKNKAISNLNLIL